MVLLHFVTEVFWWFVLQIHVTLIGETNSKPACGASHAVPCTVGTSQVGVARNFLPNHTDCEAAHTYYYLQEHLKIPGTRT